MWLTSPFYSVSFCRAAGFLSAVRKLSNQYEVKVKRQVPVGKFTNTSRKNASNISVPLSKLIYFQMLCLDMIEAFSEIRTLQFPANHPTITSWNLKTAECAVLSDFKPRLIEQQCNCQARRPLSCNLIYFSHMLFEKFGLNKRNVTRSL